MNIKTYIIPPHYQDAFTSHKGWFCTFDKPPFEVGDIVQFVVADGNSPPFHYTAQVLVTAQIKQIVKPGYIFPRMDIPKNEEERVILNKHINWWVFTYDEGKS